MAFDEKRREQLLTLLSQGNTVTFACVRVGISRQTAYRHREQDPIFSTAWKEAEGAGTQVMEQEAYRRATHGVIKPVVHQGKVVEVTMKDGKVVLADTPGAEKVPLTVREYSDVLLIFLLKARRPEVYRERAEVAVSRPPVDPAELSDEELDAIHRIIAKHRGQPVPSSDPAH